MVRKHLKNIHPTVDNGNANRFSSVLPFQTPPDWGGGELNWIMTSIGGKWDKRTVSSLTG